MRRSHTAKEFLRFVPTTPTIVSRVVRVGVEDASDDVLLAVPCANEDAGAG